MLGSFLGTPCTFMVLCDMVDISDTSVERRDPKLCAEFPWKSDTGIKYYKDGQTVTQV